MKKNILIILGIIFLIIIMIIPIGKPDRFDCIEDGICAEGLTIPFRGKTMTINQQSCIKNKGYWNNKKHICDFE